MRLQDFDEKDGKRVWLSEAELQAFIEQAENPEQRLAFLLAGRSGLRRDELIQVTPEDFTHAPDGFVRVWEEYAKGGKYRETPVPDKTQTIVETYAYDQPADEPIIETDFGHTVYRWVRRAADRLQEETGDRGWEFVGVHDLRRTWGSSLLWDHAVLPAVVMSWGGWKDWPTFRKHYLGEMSPAAADRERSKIGYINEASTPSKEESGPVFQHPMADSPPTARHSD